MSALATAAPADLERVWERLADPPRYTFVRRPEVGLVMVRGRAGGTGLRFNLGEMPVARCSVRLADGTVGHAYVGGRSLRHAELAAVFDALLQERRSRTGAEAEVVAPLVERQEARRRAASGAPRPPGSSSSRWCAARSSGCSAVWPIRSWTASGSSANVLEAMAHPGRVVTLPAPTEPPPPLDGRRGGDLPGPARLRDAALARSEPPRRPGPSSTSASIAARPSWRRPQTRRVRADCRARVGCRRSRSSRRARTSSPTARSP